MTIGANDNPGYVAVVGSRDVFLSGLNLSRIGQGLLIAGSAGMCDRAFAIADLNHDPFPLVDFEAIPISGPTVITEPGYYVLDADWAVEPDTDFIRIESDDVILDGWNNRLNGAGGTAIVAGTATDALSGLMIRNFRLEGWTAGIRLDNVRDSQVQRNSIQRTGTAILFAGSNDNITRDNRLSENGTGIFLDEESAGNRTFNNRFIEKSPVKGNSAANFWNVRPEEAKNIVRRRGIYDEATLSAAFASQAKPLAFGPGLTRVVPMEISVSQFKAKCLRIVEQVEKEGETVIITRHGRPAAHLVPVGSGGGKKLFGRARGMVRVKGDLLTTAEHWDAEG